MNTFRPEEILTRNGWYCSLDKFFELLEIRLRFERDNCLQESRCRGLHVSEQNDHWTDSEELESTSNTELVREDSIPREIWGPRHQTMIYFINDSAIPSFLQSLLPQTLMDEEELEELEALKTTLRFAYRTRIRGSSHGSWIAVNAEGQEDDQGRFSIVGGGDWDGLSEHEDFRMTVHRFMGPLPASPVRDRRQAGCFEDILDQGGQSERSSFPTLIR